MRIGLPGDGRRGGVNLSEGGGSLLQGSNVGESLPTVHRSAADINGKRKREAPKHATVRDERRRVSRRG
jgi:hypothetical protein